MSQITLSIQHAKIIMLTAGAILLSACNPAEDKAPPTTQLANPASTYCVSLGGQVEIEKQTDGEVGYCQLPNGERIEEWTLYRKAHSQTAEEDSKLVKPQVGKPNPATQNCIAQGGTVDLATSMCTLPSGEQIEQWQLYRRDNNANN
ncbi:DUF333 domain-containing protein [Shewanella fidelis]|uniref:DUF333 domain-containing protein n=1 Tax=Shewanella fidelis TaxID=173509 RepID=A0AAW8NS27_9GAMM|nr:DUF333 domain-containing protein [Shewanella fidelis]MDR8525974.1 DUF333 domain-containing protein [Shewanella fidelis]MDW4813838.1 DUF333 domain-containing protein [Shewanella fidelis]MDW4817970.1 DUF333 domain-containing protein [Shewanella fidelis]MDW4822037.1 DUF333 domain-containing protein [Shewanella fidelis]MDW4826202.1 DUF333 domain-containing protein [Shewanella fidelis]